MMESNNPPLQGEDPEMNHSPGGIPESHSAAPLEIDEGDGENQHSLPNPEELKVNPSNKSAECNATVLFALLFLLVASAIVGLSVGLTKDNRDDKQNGSGSTIGSPILGKDRKVLYEKYLLQHRISAELAFADPKSPQSKALDFLAHDDERKLRVPSGDLTSKDGYSFLTRYVMAVVYYATNGARWNYDLLFLSKHDTCEWYEIFQPPIGQVGVLCNQQTNEIVGVSFISNALDGTLPDELGYLTTITYLESIGNDVSGKVPLTFSKLSNLRTLVFAFNQLTGQIPIWMARLNELEFFYLSNNMFSGSIPAEFGNLKELAVLALDDNLFTGSSDFLWQLPKLEYVYMEDNSFTGMLPAKITDTSELLINLDVSNNRMDGKLPDDLFGLSRLEILDLHKNQFTGTIPKGSIGASNERLEFLALHGNSLSSTIPAEIGNFKALKHLDLSTNSFTGVIPTQMDFLTEITYLFLAENDFTSGSIPTFVYTYNNLRELSLKSTKRTGTISELIELLDKLVLLDLDDNELIGSIPSEIENLENLQFLLLNRNQLTGNIPAELTSLDKLRFLLVDRNELGGSLEPICTRGIPVMIADCQEVVCSCCAPCCVDNEDCHDFNLLANADPVWESSYERQFFDFGNSTLWAPADDDEFGST